ncbi:MAG: DUF1501 domain-containing protein [Pirellulaceae bacterium]
MTISSLNRRQFMRHSTALTAWGLTVPAFLKQTSESLAASPIPGLPDDRVLVLVQLAGGNDGLNTLVPYADDAYYRSRPNLAIERDSVLRIDDHCGLHPEMYALKDLYDEGQLSIVQNVGYPNPNLSHFRSTEIWETGSPAEKNWSEGWIGRYFDHACGGAQSPMLGLQLGDRTAQTFVAQRPRCVTLSNPELFEFSGGERRLRDLHAVHQAAEETPPTLDFLRRTGNDVLTVSRQIADAVRDQKTTAEYLPFHFSQALQTVAKLIAAELPTRVYYVSLGGFDHHANQENSHAVLLQELSEALTAFVHDLQEMGHLDRTLVMTFSEFGRRVAENRSGGTDHGTANMMFMAGGTSRPGLHGSQPDLTNLTPDGNLNHQIDFRSIYAAVLRDWLSTDSAQVLGNDVLPWPDLI